MTVQIYLGRDLLGHMHHFNYGHEVRGIRNVCAYLWEKFHHQDELYAVIANIRHTGKSREITPDLILISEMGIGIVDLKEYYNLIDCSDPRGTWWAGPIRIKPYIGKGEEQAEGEEQEEEKEQGGPYRNPHHQLQSYAEQIRDDLMTQVFQNWMPIEKSELDKLKIFTAICFTNPAAILTKCKELVRVHYRPGDVLKDWERFSIISPAEITEWALSLRLEIKPGPADWYRPVHFSPADVYRLATEFFGGTEWKSMVEEMYIVRKPFGYLQLIVAGKPVQLFRLDHDEVFIGRDPDQCQIVLSGRFRNVSRKHARILQIEERVMIEDAGSTYGTFIDGKQIRERTFLRSPEQLITLGGSKANDVVGRLRFLVEAPAPLPTGHEPLP